MIYTSHNFRCPPTIIIFLTQEDEMGRREDRIGVIITVLNILAGNPERKTRS
jgi:hypothetical protein